MRNCGCSHDEFKPMSHEGPYDVQEILYVLRVCLLAGERIPHMREVGIEMIDELLADYPHSLYLGRP